MEGLKYKHELISKEIINFDTVDYVPFYTSTLNNSLRPAPRIMLTCCDA